MANKGFLVFDVETRLDMDLIHATQYPECQTPALAYECFKAKLLQETQGRSDFIPVTYHIPISIAVGYVGPDYALQEVETLGQVIDTTADLFSDEVTPEAHAERQMVEDFWQLVQDGDTLVSFNGRGFDLPVLELAALKWGVRTGRYFNEKYGARYRFSEEGHYDLQDVLSNAGAAHLRGGLNALMGMIGYVGKDGVDGSMVQGMWEKGELEIIHRYCRRDVICTYALFLRLELIRSRISPEQYAHACHASESLLASIR